MASAFTQPAQGEAVASASPLVLWHLLSLDAPSVAALWTWFIARGHGVRLPVVSIAAMFLAVWALYTSDRLLDARPLGRHRSCSQAATPVGLEARHLFHHRHRTRFLAFACIAGSALAMLLPMLNHTAIRMFAAEGLLLAAWFFTLHATPFAHHLPKELALGLFFAAAVVIPTAARVGCVTLPLFLTGLLFAVLCSLNCLFIYRWELSPYTQPGHPTTHLTARYATPLAFALVVACALSAPFIPRPAGCLPAALALSSTTLFLLDRTRSRFTRTTLRAAADLALLTPLLFLVATR